MEGGDGVGGIACACHRDVVLEEGSKGESRGFGAQGGGEKPEEVVLVGVEVAFGGVRAASGPKWSW